MVKENISMMSDEHTSWLSALDFYKQELNTVKERLTEIAGKNTSKELGADIEHYENQLKVQSENIDKLSHDIHSNLAKSAAQARNSSAGYIDSALIAEHNRQKDKFLAEERVINALRQDFIRFASKWM
jgi:hypothetical protein